MNRAFLAQIKINDQKITSPTHFFQHFERIFPRNRQATFIRFRNLHERSRA